jgi:prepilin-type processing-associated H-X9-DG protein
MPNANEASERPPLSAGCFGALLLVALTLLVCFKFILPKAGSFPASAQTICRNQVRELGLSLIDYAKGNHGRFPPAYIADKNGRLIHSWRTAIVGYLGYTVLARMFRWDAPWNSPENSRLAKEFPIAEFHCPSDPGSRLDTSYVVIVGPHTLFPGTQSRGPQDIKRAGGAAETLLLVELPESKIHWMEPRDLRYEDAIRGIGTSGKPISSVHSGGIAIGGKKIINVCFADGHAQVIPLDGFAEFVKNHARIDDGPVDSPPRGSPLSPSTQGIAR